MRFWKIFGLVVLLASIEANTVSAGTATGATTLLAIPNSGAYLDVDVSVVSETPVVPYEYVIQNECFFSGRTTGRPDSFQRDAIVNWVYSAPAPYGNVPHAIMTLNLLAIPPGSACKVSLVKNNTSLKGSTTLYIVQP